MQTYDTEGIKAQAGRFSPDTETCPFGLLYLFNDISKRKKSQNDERENDMDQAKVGVIMGSTSDWETMRHACHVLQELKIAYEKKVVSAHRTPDEMFAYAEQAQSKGLQVIIAGAGGAAHLPGMIASKTVLPVIGVPVKTSTLNGLDSLLSIVQMPGGVPVATTAIGKAGAVNSGLLAAEILGLTDTSIQQRLKERREEIRHKVLAESDLAEYD